MIGNNIEPGQYEEQQMDHNMLNNIFGAIDQPHINQQSPTGMLTDRNRELFQDFEKKSEEGFGRNELDENIRRDPLGAIGGNTMPQQQYQNAFAQENAMQSQLSNQRQNIPSMKTNGSALDFFGSNFPGKELNDNLLQPTMTSNHMQSNIGLQPGLLNLHLNNGQKAPLNSNPLSIGTIGTNINTLGGHQ